MATPRKLRERSAPLQNGATSPSQQSRRRAFTKRDETRILKTYLRVLSESPMATTAEISNESLNAIQASLSASFCHSQIVEKLRRLRLAFHRHVRSDSLVETPHEEKLFSIARRIWGIQKRPREETETEAGEEFAAVREEFRRALPGNGVWEEGLAGLDREEVRDFNRRWLLLRMEEAELAARKAVLMSESTRAVLDALGTHFSV